MATQDISRFLLQPTKHYSSLHLQQGRVIVDSDWNERAGIEAEELRQTVLDIVCSRGTPNDGFEVTVPAPPERTVTTPEGSYSSYDFRIGGGSYYIAGLRFAVDHDDGYEQFLAQSDWLQLTSLNANLPFVFKIGSGDRTDLVYVCGWEQPVTAVEDSELREVALGGRDTSVRIKRMRRFMVEVDTASDCPKAFQDLITDLQEGGKASYDWDTGELVSLGRLRVQSGTEPVSEDPCVTPSSSGGYVGAENQTIRVELRPGVEPGFDGKLIWGFDNASKLYRVKVSGTTATFLTDPEDLASMPRAGQVVELLQWGAKLPNLEKVAETQGLVALAATAYDPGSKELELDLDAAAQDQIADWNTWLADHDEHHNPDDGDNEQYLYLRIWDRGSELLSTGSSPLIDYNVDVAVPLGNTGLEVVITNEGKDGDYWIVAARPSTPNVVTPWDLGEGAGVGPHGPRRFYAPLGLIQWQDGASVSYDVSDCRTPLRQLCEGGTCTITVGDGKQSFGQVSSLQDAIDLASDGSKICVLPGEHEGHAVIADRHNLIIEGCGARSILKNVQPTATNTDFTAFDAPIIKIEDSTDIVIKDLGILGYSAVGVEIVEDDGTCEKITLDKVLVGCMGGYTLDAAGGANSWWLPASGITVAAASEVDIKNCFVGMSSLLSYAFGVVLGGDAIRMRGCRISAGGSGGVSPALGGVNVRSGSRDVEIVDCDIDGGWGHGVALGHGRDYTLFQTPTREQVLKEKPTIGAAETAVEPDSEPSNCECDRGQSSSVKYTLELSPKFLPAGSVENVRIYDNRIRNMGMSGISTSLFWPANFDYGTDAGAPRFIVVNEVDIARNLVEDNVRLSLPAAGFIDLDVAVGGVCLAASTNAWVHENTIRNNGTQHTLTPVCGVGLIAAMNAVIEDNQIVDNGVRMASGSRQVLQRGLRGGIVVGEASGVRTQAKPNSAEHMPTFPMGTANEYPPPPVEDWLGVSPQAAVTVRGNEVSHPLGRALWISRGFGPIVVTGNSLESYGSPVLDDGVPGAAFAWLYKDLVLETYGALKYAAAGACVEVSNLALSGDTVFDTAPAEYPAMQYVDPGQDQIAGGEVLMSGNRLRLEWDWLGGWAASALVQSLGSVVFQGNAAEIVTGGQFSTALPESDKDWEFVTTVCGRAEAQAFVLTNVFVGARSSASLVGNRLTEGRWDAVFSALVGLPALAVDRELVKETDASLAASNVGSHCVIAADDGGDAALKSDNLEIYGFQKIVGGFEFDCDDAEIYTGGVSGQSQLVGVSMELNITPG